MAEKVRGKIQGKKPDKQTQCQTAAQDGSTSEKMLCTTPAEILGSAARRAAKQGRKGTGRSQTDEQQPNTDRPELRSFMPQEFCKT